MFKYFLAINFIFFGNTRDLFTYWKHEVIRRDKLSLHRLLREKKHFGRNYLFWWRLANEMYFHGGKLEKKAAKQLNALLITKFGCEISLGAKIGKGLTIPHHHGIVIHHAVIIGENFVIRQNTTIGQKDGESKSLTLRIGDNVDIGANTCIIGLGHNIGDNVKIGAMSLVNSDIPDNCTFITAKTSRLITHNAA